MDPIKNPFSPGAGSPPHELVGRKEVVEQARILLGRIRQKRPEKSILLTGLRGVGKTVLLNEMERLAEEDGYRTITTESHEGKPLAILLAPHLRSLLFKLDRMKGAADKIKRGLAVLKSFLGAVKMKVEDYEFGLDIDPEEGSADSGDLEIDLPELLIAIAEAAVDRDTAVAILIDEIQYFNAKELSALIMAMHKIQQRQLPLVLMGAGLPILPRLAGESKSYAERLFSFPDIGPLTNADSRKALQGPVKAVDVSFNEDALDEIIRLTQGYPYFLQEWGYQAWNNANSTPITLEVVKDATEKTSQRLDENFFRVRFDRLTNGEKDVLRAMGELGKGPYRTGDVAEVLGIKITSLGPRRAKLINKGMIYSPTHGDLAFTVPLFDQFMRRVIPDFRRRS
jgi:hypothetical protein